MGILIACIVATLAIVVSLIGICMWRKVHTKYIIEETDVAEETEVCTEDKHPMYNKIVNYLTTYYEGVNKFSIDILSSLKTSQFIKFHLTMSNGKEQTVLISRVAIETAWQQKELNEEIAKIIKLFEEQTNEMFEYTVNDLEFAEDDVCKIVNILRDKDYDAYISPEDELTIVLRKMTDPE